MSKASANDVIANGWYIVVVTLLGGQFGAPNLGCTATPTIEIPASTGTEISSCNHDAVMPSQCITDRAEVILFMQQQALA